MPVCAWYQDFFVRQGIHKTMEKIAFKMKLIPGNAEEYKRRHENIWPALKGLLKKYKISDYTIFLDEATDTLFAVQKTSVQHSSQDIGENPIVKEWWAYMSDIMETNPDNSPVSIPLKKVFHMK